MRRIIITASIPDDGIPGVTSDGERYTLSDHGDIAGWLNGEGLEDPTVWGWDDFWKDVDDGVVSRSELKTWTFMGHWENDKIVVEYAVPGNVQDQRIELGYWEQGLWAAPGDGVTIEEAEANAKAEYEEDEEEDQDD